MGSTAPIGSTVDWATKGLWLPDRGSGEAAAHGATGTDAAAFVAARHYLFDGPFCWPVMVARRSAIEANIATMAAYCARHGVEFAPHGKTTMAPTLFAAQLAAGAWGITVATPHQAVVARHFGVPRVLLANEVLDPRVLRWAAEQISAGWEFLCYVDSLEGVAALHQALAGRDDLRLGGGRLPVLVEVGFDHGRAGCRSLDQTVTVARAADACPGVAVAGVACFEGLLPDADAVTRLMQTLVAAAEQVAPLCAGSAPPIVSAGGSAYFDTVVQVLVPAAEGRWRVLLRSGAVVTHDDGTYAAATPFGRAPEEGSLTAALEVWAQVLSTPEPGLAIVGAGKRDLPFDEGMPMPRQARAVDGSLRALPTASVEWLNDQHAYLRGDETLRPGELVALGISHPCTAFDKWRVIPVVDDDYRVVDLLRTYF